MDELSILVNYKTVEEAKELILLLKDIESILQNFNHDNGSNANPQDEFQVEIMDVESSKVFRQYGGVEVFHFIFKNKSSKL